MSECIDGASRAVKVKELRLEVKELDEKLEKLNLEVKEVEAKLERTQGAAAAAVTRK